MDRWVARRCRATRAETRALVNALIAELARRRMDEEGRRIDILLGVPPGSGRMPEKIIPCCRC